MPFQTTISVTQTVNTALYCYTYDKKILFKPKTCQGIRRGKRAIEVDGIDGLVRKTIKRSPIRENSFNPI